MGERVGTKMRDRMLITKQWLCDSRGMRLEPSAWRGRRPSTLNTHHVPTTGLPLWSTLHVLANARVDPPHEPMPSSLMLRKTRRSVSAKPEPPLSLFRLVAANEEKRRKMVSKREAQIIEGVV
jgi:hypothetical protein